MKYSPSTPLLVIALAATYIAAFLLTDTHRWAIDHLGDVSVALQILAITSLTAYFLRFLRYRILLLKHGFSTTFLHGLIAYIAGFALTASPGKLGELIRIRYFALEKVPPETTISCCVTERIFDLLVLLAFASLLINSSPGYFGALIVFVVFAIIVVYIAGNLGACRPMILLTSRRPGWPILYKATRAALSGLDLAWRNITLSMAVTSAVLGILAWGVQCTGFALALLTLKISLPFLILFAVPAAAMLLGAATFVPGGIGTTEMANVALLSSFGIDLDRTILAAVVLRVGSLWFATVLGFIAMTAMEARIERLSRSEREVVPLDTAASTKLENSDAIR